MSSSLLPPEGFALDASDSTLGIVSDLLFDDATWLVRWIVVDIGPGPRGPLVLLHPSVIVRVDRMNRRVLVRLTKLQVEQSPDILLDEPVSRQIEYGENTGSNGEPVLGQSRLVAGFWGGMGVQVSQARLGKEKSMHKAIRGGGQNDAGDPHLRSVTAIIGNVVHAADGALGHVWNVLIDEPAWSLRTFIVDTHHWWPGRRLAVPVSAVGSISWSHQEVSLDISREAVKAIPTWDLTDLG